MTGGDDRFRPAEGDGPALESLCGMSAFTPKADIPEAAADFRL